MNDPNVLAKFKNKQKQPLGVLRKNLKNFLKNFAIPQANICAEVSFRQSCKPLSCKFIKKRIQHKCFPVDFSNSYIKKNPHDIHFLKAFIHKKSSLKDVF